MEMTLRRTSPDNAPSFRIWGGDGQRDDDIDTWPSPEDPRPVAQRIVTMADVKGQPLRYWNGLWFFWNGTYYQQITTESIRDNLYQILGDAAYIGAKGDPLRWKPNQSKLNGVIDAARGLVKVPEDAEAPCWSDGHDEQVIPCKNGLLRLRDRTLLPHTADYFNLMAMPFDFDESAPPPTRWLQFLKEVFPDDHESVAALQEWFGYVVSGRRDLEKMLMVIGRRRSGKGTITHVLEQLVGRNNFTGISGDHFRNDFGYQPLLGKTLATFTDARVTFGKKLVEAILRITGGDTVSVNRKNKEQVAVKLSTRLMFMSNEIPVLPDDSGAIESRLVPLYMPVSFDGKGDNPKPDPTLKDTLTGELPGIFRWALDGLDRLQERGAFVTPKSAAKYMETLEESGSPVKQFLTERCEFGNDKHGEDFYVNKDLLYNEWKLWCHNNGHEAGTKVMLSRKLIAAMPDVAPKVEFNHAGKRGPRGKQTPTYVGLRLQGGQ
jgi:putative DNA primase/helicase